MSCYYYFAATLPSLRPDGQPAMSSAAFRRRCSQQLNERDARIIEDLCDDEFSAPRVHRTIERWRQFDGSLRNQLARLRAESLQWEAAEHLRGPFCDEASLTETASRIATAGDPLLAENLLHEARWKFLTELERQHFMNFDFLLIYALKLKLLEERVRLSRSRGERALEEARSTLSSHLSRAGGVWS